MRESLIQKAQPWRASMNRREGFTIVELLVAVTLFVTAMAFVTGSFFQAIRTQALVNDLMAMNSNASLIIEQMAREIRVGYDFVLSDTPLQNLFTPCDGTYSMYDTLSFTRPRESATATVWYRWNDIDGSIERAEGSGFFEPLTPSTIKVSHLCFTETQHTINSTYPWRITLFMTIAPANPDLAAHALDLETTVSGRILPSDVVPAP